MSELPQGWEQRNLASVATITSGFGFPKELQGKTEGKVPFAKVSDISFSVHNNNGLLRSATNYVDDDDIAFIRAKIIPSGSTVFAKIGEALRLNRRALTQVPLIIDNNCMALTPNSQLIDPHYLFIYMTTVDISHLSVSTTVPSVRRGDIGDISIPLPPLEEQRQIVAKLDLLLSRSKAARAELAAVTKLAKRQRQAVLAQAFSGELTADWREERGLEYSNWMSSKLGDLASIGTGATPNKSNSAYYENGTIPWVTSTVVNQNIVTHAEACITPLALSETNCKVFPKGTILVAMYGEGKTRGQVSVLGIDAATNQALAAISVHQHAQVIQQFVVWFLRSNYLNLRQQAAGGVQPNLNLSIIKAIPIELPSLEEQHEIVRRIEAAFARIDASERHAQQALALAERLEQATLAKAFRGEL